MTPLSKQTYLERVLWFFYSSSQKKVVFWPVMIVSAFIIAFHYFFLIGVNFSNSMPYHYYIFSKHFDVNNLKRNDVVLASYQGAKYFPHGTHFVKMVGGLPGDRVAHKGRDIYINDKFLGRAKLRSGPNEDGFSLEISKEGIIPKGHYFLYTKSKDSFDSRYKAVGLEDDRSILGKSILGFGSGIEELKSGSRSN